MKKLLLIQTELKAPKNQRNNFGNYNYRSAEDILEALKPLLLKHKASITVTDEIVQVGDRYYIKATVTLTDIENNEVMQTSAFAREEESKKGMDGSQITGSASSYARKYALNGMFAIDDTKDADGWNKHGKEETKKDTEQRKFQAPTMKEVATLKGLLKEGEEKIALDYYKVESLNDIHQEEIRKMIAKKSNV